MHQGSRRVDRSLYADAPRFGEDRLRLGMTAIATGRPLADQSVRLRGNLKQDAVFQSKFLACNCLDKLDETIRGSYRSCRPSFGLSLPRNHRGIPSAPLPGGC